MKSGFLRPVLALSSRSAPFIRLESQQAIARAARLDGIDIDLSRNGWFRSWSASADSTNVEPAAVTSVWIAANAKPGPNGIPEALESLEAALLFPAGLTIVVTDGGETLELGPAGPAFAAARRLATQIDRRHRIAIAINPSTRDSGSAHVARLRALRSLAEEWELGLALDLRRADDWQWEAEAAVHHTANCLELIRLNLPAPSFDARVRTRITARTLAASVDAGFRGIYSIYPSVPFWRWRDSDLLVERSAEAKERIVKSLRGGHGPAIRSGQPTPTRR